MTEEFLRDTIERFKDSPERPQNSENKGQWDEFYLFGTLERAYLGLDKITPGRLGLFAEKATAALDDAISAMRAGNSGAAMEIMVKVANAFDAFSIIDKEVAGGE
jgi:hypothetical protein